MENWKELFIFTLEYQRVIHERLWKCLIYYYYYILELLKPKTYWSQYKAFVEMKSWGEIRVKNLWILFCWLMKSRRIILAKKCKQSPQLRLKNLNAEKLVL